MSGPRLLNYNELRSEKGINFTRRHLDRLEQAGKFPRRVPIGDRAVAWVEKEINEWIAKKMSQRSGTAGTIGSHRQAS